MGRATAGSESTTSFSEWMERNPLRSWRKASGTSIMEAASRLGVSMTTIQLWERGVNVPTDENLQSLQGLIGDDAMRWADWWNGKPSN